MHNWDPNHNLTLAKAHQAHIREQAMRSYHLRSARLERKNFLARTRRLLAVALLALARSLQEPSPQPGPKRTVERLPTK